MFLRTNLAKAKYFSSIVKNQILRIGEKLLTQYTDPSNAFDILLWGFTAFLLDLVPFNIFISIMDDGIKHLFPTSADCVTLWRAPTAL